MLHPSLIPTFHADESPASACSRAAYLAGRTARDFCLDMGFTFSGIVEGREDCLAALVRVSRLDAGFPGIPVSGSGRSFEIARQAFTRDTLSRQRLRVCPVCIAQDMAHGTGPLEARPYGRTIWLVDSVRTCPRHRCPLVVASQDGKPGTLHDFAHLLAPVLDRIRDQVRTPRRREPSALELDLCARLADKTPSSGWLAQFPAYAVCRISEILGAIVDFGARFRSADLSDEDWHRAGHIGHEIANAGDAGIESFLSDLRARFEGDRHHWGGRQIFGRLYEWLAHENDDPVFHPLRSLIHDYIVRTMPVGPGEMVLGMPVERRLVHSVQSFHSETGAHPKRLRKLLLSAGVIDATSLELSDERVTFDAQAVLPVIDQVAGTLTLAGAADYLNTPRPHERLLMEAGFISPAVMGSKRGAVKHVFRRDDLDQFLQNLLRDATPCCSTDGDLRSIPDAARRANCSAAEIVGLLVDQRLATVRSDPTERGYLSVLVDPEEVLPLVRAAEHGGIPLREVTRRMATSDRVVKTLIDLGHLPARRAINPVNRCPQTVIDPPDLRVFMNRYVSLTALSRETGVHFRRLAVLLSESRIEPVFDPGAVGATFFDRTQCAAVSVLIKG